jgi:hypothetical protein
MSTCAYYLPRQIDVDLSNLDEALFREIISLKGHIHRDTDPPVLLCRVNWTSLYIVKNHYERYFARHFPGDNPNDHKHPVNLMSTEHRTKAEYAARAAQAAGLEASLEFSTGGGTRLDVAITSPQGQAGFEIQRSDLSRAKAKARAFNSFNAGWKTMWVHDQIHAPDWAGHVPTARLTTRGGWSEKLPPPNTAKVIIQEFYRERDGLRWRYQRRPTEVLFDELAVLGPSGEIETVTVGKHGLVMLARHGAAEIIDSCTYPGASRWVPTKETPRNDRPRQRISRPCHNPHAERGDPPLWLPKETPAPLPPVFYPAEPAPTPVPSLLRCLYCGELLLAPVSQSRGFCERCRIDGYDRG